MAKIEKSSRKSFQPIQKCCRLLSIPKPLSRDSVRIRPDGHESEKATGYLLDIKNSFFYWNWLARVAKSNNKQRKGTMKTTTTKSKTNGKTAILVVATIIAVALITQTTGPTAQSTGTPNLPDPPPVPEPSFPPFPPGAFNNCLEQYYSRHATIAQGYASQRKQIDDFFNAKLTPVEALIAAKFKLIDDLEAKIRSIETSPAYYAAYVGIVDLQPYLDEINRLRRKINDAWNRIHVIRRDQLQPILDCYVRWIEWLNEKTARELKAAWEEYENCLDSETNND